MKSIRQLWLQKQNNKRKAAYLALGLLVSNFFACSNKANFADGNKTMAGRPTASISAAAAVSSEATSPQHLKIKAFIGADSFSNNPCANPPGTHSAVATMLLPVDYCLSGSSAAEATTEICMLINDSDTVPTEDNACWKSRIAFDPIAVLKIGDNKVQLFARDIHGNTASDGGGVDFRQGAAPLINFLQPVAAEIAYVPWKAGSTHTIKVEVTDDDSQFKDLKIIVSLISKNDSTKFKHIGCSFANNQALKQCPDASLYNSPIIVADAAKNLFTINYIVPSDFSDNQVYSVFITAIDQAGNASIASTQEINRGFEVLAGRSYKGYGGTGSTIEPVGDYADIYVDKRKAIYLPQKNIKIDPFDTRTCRLFRSSEADRSAIDCKDSVVSEFTIDNKWAYNSKGDIFYATGESALTGQRHLLKMDFKAKTVTPVISSQVASSAGTLLTDQIPANTKASLVQFEVPAPKVGSGYALGGLSKNLWFIESKQLLIFNYKNQLFSLNNSGEIRFVLGSSQGQTSWPLDQKNISQAAVNIPSDGRPFAVSEDGRILFGGTQDAEKNSGAGLGNQYILTGFDPQNLEAKVSLEKLLPGNTTDDPRNYHIASVTYDAVANRFIATLGWFGAYQMKLPAVGDPQDKNIWNQLTKYDKDKTETSLADSLASDQASDGSFVSGPRASLHFAFGVVNAAPEIIYLTERRNGLVFSFNIKTNRMALIVGYRAGLEPTQMAINRRLYFPRFISLDDKGDVVFSDKYNLQRIKLSEKSTSAPNIETLISGFPIFPVTLDRSKNQLLLFAADGFSKYNYLSLTSPPTVYKGSTYKLEYVTGAGFSNDLVNLKVASIGGRWGGQSVKESFSVSSAQPASGFDVVTTLMSHTDSISTGYVEPLQTTASEYLNPGVASGIYDPATFRMAPVVSNRLQFGLGSKLAYTADDNSYIACAFDPQTKTWRFAEFDMAEKKIYMFDVLLNGTSIGACNSIKEQFQFSNGAMYLGSFAKSAVYSLDLTKIREFHVSNATLVKVKGSFAGEGFNGLFVDSKYVYYTDASNRVIRNERLP